MKLSHTFSLIAGMLMGHIPSRRRRSRDVQRENLVAHNRRKQRVGNQRRINAWLKSVAGGYDAKRKLVDAGKGRNTLAGIPA